MLSADLPSLSAAAADMDDSFGQFTAITPASVLPSQAASPAPFLSPPGGAAAAAAAAAAEDGGGLQATLKSLIEQERFEEASACKAHIEAIAQLSVQMIAYERAKEEDDLETAIHLKKVVLPSLRDKKQPEHVVAQWQLPNPGSLTLAQMAQQASSALGDAEAAPFVARCCSSAGVATPTADGTGLSESAQRQGVASAMLALLLELPPAQQAAHLEQMDRLLDAIMQQLRAACSALEKPKPPNTDDATHAANLASSQVTTCASHAAQAQAAPTRAPCSLPLTLALGPHPCPSPLPHPSPLPLTLASPLTRAPHPTPVSSRRSASYVARARASPAPASGSAPSSLPRRRADGRRARAKRCANRWPSWSAQA